MSSTKIVAGFAIVVLGIAAGFKEQRQSDLEGDSALAPMIESKVRMNAGDFNPKVQLTQPELRDFQIIAVQITRPRISSILDLASGGGDRKYGVYVRFREGGGDRCMTLALEWRSKTEDWSVSHPGTMDSCGPAW